jgi:hypothetical protein
VREIGTRRTGIGDMRDPYSDGKDVPFGAEGHEDGARPAAIAAAVHPLASCVSSVLRVLRRNSEDEEPVGRNAGMGRPSGPMMG